MTGTIQTIGARALRFDYRTTWFAVGRTTLAMATASELLFSKSGAMFAPVGGRMGPLCTAQPAVSVFCLGDPQTMVEMRWWLTIGGLLLVATGFRPRYLGPLHLWLTFSVATSISLPDGGDAIALILTILIAPMCVADDRRWQWSIPDRHMSQPGRVISYLSFWALRIQLAYLYADSAIAKMGIPDWQNGSAFYYFVRDKMFGAAGPLASLWLWLSDHSLTTLAITWGAIVIELILALFILLSTRWRDIAFWLGFALHTLIFLSMGLFSFSLAMVAAGSLIATPDTLVRRRERRPVLRRKGIPC